MEFQGRRNLRPNYRVGANGSYRLPTPGTAGVAGFVGQVVAHDGFYAAMRIDGVQGKSWGSPELVTGVTPSGLAGFKGCAFSLERGRPAGRTLNVERWT